MRVTAFLTNTPPGMVPGQAAGLELRHRQHARVEDRIRQAKATGLRNYPCQAWNENNAWLETVLTAVDLLCWTKLLCFDDIYELARCEIAAFRYRVLHVAARLTRAARRAPPTHRRHLALGPHIAKGRMGHDRGDAQHVVETAVVEPGAVRSWSARSPQDSQWRPTAPNDIQ